MRGMIKALAVAAATLTAVLGVAAPAGAGQGTGIGLIAAWTAAVVGVVWMVTAVQACGHSTAAGTPICSAGPACFTAAACKWPCRMRTGPWTRAMRPAT
jgi:hypothetical protein